MPVNYNKLEMQQKFVLSFLVMDTQLFLQIIVTVVEPEQIYLLSCSMAKGEKKSRTRNYQLVKDKNVAIY